MAKGKGKSRTEEPTLSEREARCVLAAIMRGAGGSVATEDLAPLFAQVERKVASMKVDAALFQLIMDDKVDLRWDANRRDLVFVGRSSDSEVP